MPDAPTRITVPLAQLQRRLGVEGDLDGAWPILVRQARLTGWTVETPLEAVRAGESVVLTRKARSSA